MSNVIDILARADETLATAADAKQQQPIYEHEGRTWMSTKGDPYLVGNGTVEVTHTCVDATGNSFIVRVRRAGSNEAHQAKLSMDIIENAAKLNAFLASTAISDFYTKNANGSAAAFKRFLFSQPGAATVVYELTNYGWDEQHHIVAAANSYIDAEGNYVPRRPTFATDLMCRDGVVRSFRNSKPPRGAPVITSGATLEQLREDANRLADIWHKNLGNHHGMVGIAHMILCMYRHHLITENNRAFHHLYLFGQTQCGKDTFARILMRAFGVTAEACLSAGRGTSEKSIRNALGDIYGWPLWINELRDSREFEHLSTTIRTSYDGQGSTNLNRDQTTREFPTRRPLLLTGESILGRNAELSRYLLLEIRPPVDPGTIGDLETAAATFARHVHTLFKHQNELITQIDEVFPAWETHFTLLACDRRRARAWGLIAAVMSILSVKERAIRVAQPVLSMPEHLRQYLNSASMFAMDLSSESSVMQDFNQKVELARNTGKLLNIDADGNKTQMSFTTMATHQDLEVLAVDLHGVYQAVAQALKDVPPWSLVRNEWMSRRSFICTGKVRFEPNGNYKRALFFDHKLGEDTPAWCWKHQYNPRRAPLPTGQAW